jgi:hypothetical protein
MMTLAPLKAIILAIFFNFYAFSMVIFPLKQSLTTSTAMKLRVTSADESE